MGNNQIDGGGALKNTGKYIIAGGLAGVLNGLFGAGGGLLLVPLLTNWAKLEEKQAFATSVAIILPLSIVSYGLYWWQQGGVFTDTLPYLLGGILGGLLSSRLFQNISAVWLHRLFEPALQKNS